MAALKTMSHPFLESMALLLGLGVGLTASHLYTLAYLRLSVFFSKDANFEHTRQLPTELVGERLFRILQDVLPVKTIHPMVRAMHKLRAAGKTLVRVDLLFQYVRYALSEAHAGQLEAPLYPCSLGWFNSLLSCMGLGENQLSLLLKDFTRVADIKDEKDIAFMSEGKFRCFARGQPIL